MGKLCGWIRFSEATESVESGDFDNSRCAESVNSSLHQFQVSDAKSPVFGVSRRQEEGGIVLTGQAAISSLEKGVEHVSSDK